MTDEKLVKLQYGEFLRLDQCPFGLFEYNDTILYKFPMGRVFQWFMVKGEQPEDMHEKSLVRPVSLADVAPVVVGEVK